MPVSGEENDTTRIHELVSSGERGDFSGLTPENAEQLFIHIAKSYNYNEALSIDNDANQNVLNSLSIWLMQHKDAQQFLIPLCAQFPEIIGYNNDTLLDLIFVKNPGCLYKLTYDELFSLLMHAVQKNAKIFSIIVSIFYDYHQTIVSTLSTNLLPALVQICFDNLSIDKKPLTRAVFAAFHCNRASVIQLLLSPKYHALIDFNAKDARGKGLMVQKSYDTRCVDDYYYGDPLLTHALIADDESLYNHLLKSVPTAKHIYTDLAVKILFLYRRFGSNNMPALQLNENFLSRYITDLQTSETDYHIRRGLIQALNAARKVNAILIFKQVLDFANKYYCGGDSLLVLREINFFVLEHFISFNKETVIEALGVAEDIPDTVLTAALTEFLRINHPNIEVLLDSLMNAVTRHSVKVLKVVLDVDKQYVTKGLITRALVSCLQKDRVHSAQFLVTEYPAFIDFNAIFNARSGRAVIYDYGLIMLLMESKTADDVLFQALIQGNLTLRNIHQETIFTCKVHYPWNNTKYFTPLLAKFCEQQNLSDLTDSNVSPEQLRQLLGLEKFTSYHLINASNTWVGNFSDLGALEWPRDLARAKMVLASFPDRGVLEGVLCYHRWFGSNTKFNIPATLLTLAVFENDFTLCSSLRERLQIQHLETDLQVAIYNTWENPNQALDEKFLANYITDMQSAADDQLARGLVWALETNNIVIFKQIVALGRNVIHDKTDEWVIKYILNNSTSFNPNIVRDAVLSAKDSNAEYTKFLEVRPHLEHLLVTHFLEQHALTTSSPWWQRLIASSNGKLKLTDILEHVRGLHIKSTGCLWTSHYSGHRTSTFLPRDFLASIENRTTEENKAELFRIIIKNIPQAKLVGEILSDDNLNKTIPRTRNKEANATPTLHDLEERIPGLERNRNIRYGLFDRKKTIEERILEIRKDKPERFKNICRQRNEAAVIMSLR